MSTHAETAALPKGDQRRAALLASLGELLAEVDLDAVNVADISRRAGVTRSAFYFYFENKAVAAAALSEQMYAGALDAARRLEDTTRTPRERVREMADTLFGAVEDHAHLIRATLEARARSAAVREMWDAQRVSFVEIVAGVVRAERAARGHDEGPDPETLAAMLLELNDRAVERLAQGVVDRHDLVEVVVTVWLRAIFGSDPEPGPDDDPDHDPDHDPQQDPTAPTDQEPT